MKPDVPIVLGAMASALASQVTPEIETPFVRQTVGQSAVVMAILAHRFDRIAAMLVEENEAVARLLEAGRSLVAADELREKIAEALPHAQVADLRVSALEEANSHLRRVLISLHAELESHPGEEEGAMVERIWDELLTSTLRRHVEVGL